MNAQDIIKKLQEQAATEAAASNSGSGVKKTYLGLDDGDSYTMRFLPPKGGLAKNLPWREFWGHWVTTAKGKEFVVCTQSYANPFPCPMCEKVKRLRESGAKEEADRMKAKHRTVLYGIDRYETVAEGETPTLQVFEIAQWFFRDFRSLLIRDDGFVGMDTFNNEAGYDVVVERTGKQTNTSYTFTLRQHKTATGIAATKTPLFETQEEIDSFMDSIPDIHKFKSIEFSASEINAMLNLETSQKALLAALFKAKDNEKASTDTATSGRKAR